MARSCFVLNFSLNVIVFIVNDHLTSLPTCLPMPCHVTRQQVPGLMRRAVVVGPISLRISAAERFYAVINMLSTSVVVFVVRGLARRRVSTKSSALLHIIKILSRIIQS